MTNINQLKLTALLFLVIASLFIIWKFPLTLGLDIQGGTSLVFQAQPTDKIELTNDAVQGATAVIQNRIDALGVTEPNIQRKGKDQIVVELPGVKDPTHAIKIIGDTALLEFAEAEWSPAAESALDMEKVKAVYGPDARVAKVPEYEGKKLVSEKPIILKKVVLTGADLKGVWPSVDEYGNPIVDIEFKGSGAKIFGEVTASNIGKPIAILLDKKIISAPNVREAIPSGRAQISGNFSADEVSDLVVKLKAGSLPIPIHVIETRIVGPTLGKDSVDKSVFAGIVGFSIVLIFMVLYYRIPGLLADIALVIYIILVLAVLSLLRSTLTLPGIAGFLLSIGMAVDANIIIFERFKEELRQKKTIRNCIVTSFERAFSAILDSNVTTIIAAITLFMLGTGTIKGFAITLTVGIIISMFTAIVITKLFMDLMVEWGIVKDSDSPMLYK